MTTISVNNPLRIRQFTIYQTDWLVNALRLKLGNMYIVQKKFIKANINGKVCWLSSFYLDKKRQIFFIILDLNNTILVCNSSGIILNEVPIGQQFYVNFVPITVQEIILSTGLQIKTDPGIIFVYFGFFVMILSTFTSYISYSQVWVYVRSESLDFVGLTNRSILFFEQDMILISKTCSFYSDYFSFGFHKISNTLR
uniref:Cytochrome c biogenesis protein ccs1 n=1 Tax=Lophosiphonia teges TaxID=2007110 RepID=A0A1Z1MVU6_9FLOR|nr:cytochrome c biogenesis protein ccs1 [Polysiphonia teges]